MFTSTILYINIGSVILLLLKYTMWQWCKITSFCYNTYTNWLNKQRLSNSIYIIYSTDVACAHLPTGHLSNKMPHLSCVYL